MAGIFTLSLISYILTVGLRDFGGRHFLSLISYIQTVELRDCGGRHFHSLTHMLYTDCGTVGLRWQAFLSFTHHTSTAGLQWY